MFKKIRKSVFETNSSSMHSICITGEDRYDGFPDGKIPVEFREFGWGYDTLTGVNEKISYVLTSLPYYDHDVTNIATLKESRYFKWLNEVMQDYLGCELDLSRYDDSDDELGYVDHQSIDTLDNHWVDDEIPFKENMKELIFNDKFSIIIDNDNH